MRTRNPLTAFLFTLACLPAQAQGTWTPKADFGGIARAEAIGFSIGHKGYIGLGTDYDTGLQQDLWEYDPIANAWAQKANFGGAARRLAIAFVVANKGYVGTGIIMGNVLATDLWEYNPTTNTWLQRASIGGVGRNSATAFAIGTFGYVCGGNGAGGVLQDVWRYSPSLNQWTQRTNFGGGVRRGASAFAINGLGYVGLGSGSGNVNKSDLWSFNPASNTWTQRANFPGTARSLAIGFTAGSFGYMGTGTDGSLRNDVYRYDPGTNLWSAMANAPTALRSGAAFVIADKGYVGTGTPTNSSLITRNFYQYAPGNNQAAADSWTRKADSPGGSRTNACGFSIGSKCYVCGGGGFPYKKDVWEFDALINSWSQKADISSSVLYSAVGFTIGAKGYIVGGRTINTLFGNEQNTSNVREYDPATNTWTAKASAPFALFRSAGFSVGTKGYVGTGSTGGGLVSGFWEFDPLGNTWTAKAEFPGGIRADAVGFSIGAKGYMGTGLADENLAPVNDFWEYDPASNTWTAKANAGGGAVADVVGIGLGAKGYMQGAGTQFWEYDPVTNGWTQRADILPGTGGPVGFAIGSKAYIGGSPKLGEYEPGPVNCSANQVTLALSTDAFSSETRWEILPSGNPNPVCNGGGYASNTTIDINCCLPNGCYDLRVFDSFGDGILSPGGYTLRDASNQRIVDNNGNGSTFTTVSQVTNSNSTPWSFCVPLGTDALVSGSCDQVFALNSTVTLQVQENTALTAQLDALIPNTSGYQICIFDPNGGFRRNVFLSFAAPGTAFPVGTSIALKPTFFNLNFSQAPFLPLNKLLNVRVRSKLNGVFFDCGPACRLVLGTPPCTTTKLTTTASPQISCGAQNVSVNGGTLFCDLVPGANRYRFQFAGPNNYLRNAAAPAAAVNSQAARTLTLANFQQQPLPCGVPLTVRVQASFNGGVTFCPFGPDCSISVTGCPGGQQRALEDDAPVHRISLWPNPNNGREVHLSINELPATANNIAVDVFDLTGKKVATRTLPAQGTVNAVIDLGGLSQGAYVVSVTAGEERFMERLVVE